MKMEGGSDEESGEKEEEWVKLSSPRHNQSYGDGGEADLKWYVGKGEDSHEFQSSSPPPIRIHH